MSEALAVDETAPVLAPVVAVSRRDAVCIEIRRGIVLGALKPGDRLTETGLSASLQVSRPTVREALGQLGREGLVVSEPYRGLRVADLNLKALRDLAKTRVSLDMLAVRDIVADATGRRMQQLSAAWTAYQRVLHDPDPYVRHQEHLAFHRAIWIAADNEVLDQLWPVIEAKMTIALSQDEAARPSTQRSERMHSELVASILTRDLVEIERVVTAHTLTSADEFIAMRAGTYA